MSDSNQLVRAALIKDPRPSHAIGALVGIHAVSVRRFRTGKKNLSGPVLENLAVALGFRLETKLKKSAKL